MVCNIMVVYAKDEAGENPVYLGTVVEELFAGSPEGSQVSGLIPDHGRRLGMQEVKRAGSGKGFYSPSSACWIANHPLVGSTVRGSIPRPSPTGCDCGKWLDVV